jgi:hypothetical protein
MESAAGIHALLILFLVISTMYLKWRKNATTYAEVV